MATHRREDEKAKADQPDRRTFVDRLFARLPERVQRQPIGVFFIEALIGLCLIAFIVAFVTTWRSSGGATDPATTTVAQPSVMPPTPTAAPTGSLVAAPGVPVDTDVAPAPGMDPSLAPPDGPAPDQPPFGVDAVAMRDELRTHGVDLPDSKLQALVDMADKYIGQDDPDLDAWDPRIMADVKAMWPELDKNHVIDVTRCTAEYIERVIARNHGWAHPPDEDDHGVEVDGHGTAPRVSTVVPGGEATGGN